MYVEAAQRHRSSSQIRKLRIDPRIQEELYAAKGIPHRQPMEIRACRRADWLFAVLMNEYVRHPDEGVPVVHSVASLPWMCPLR